MNVYSFSGPSGTGKSSFALELAHQLEVDAIIDDGLFIMNGCRKAGTSAKFEKSAFKAVKRAIFSDDAHVEEVRVALQEVQPEKLMIIGTSDRMTIRIAERLGVGEIEHFYHIDEYRTSKQMKMAKFIRKTEGKHIMPVPFVEVQQNFFKRLVMKGFEIFSTKKEKIGETTIVQPDFHEDLLVYKTKDFTQSIRQVCEDSPYIMDVTKLQFTLYPLPITKLVLVYSSDETERMDEKLYMLQQQINQAFDEQFEIEFDTIDLQVEHLASQKKPLKIKKQAAVVEH